MNAVLDFLNACLDFVVSVLAMGLQAAGRAALSNVPAAEWTLAVVMAFVAWLLAGRRGSAALNLLLFALTVTASAWLSWKTNHHGVLTQHVVLAALSLHGLRGRGWTLAGKASTR